MVSVRSFCNMEDLLSSCVEYLCCKSWLDFNTLQSKFSLLGVAALICKLKLSVDLIHSGLTKHLQTLSRLHNF